MVSSKGNQNMLESLEIAVGAILFAAAVYLFAFFI
jgi:hypothetical protein